MLEPVTGSTTSCVTGKVSARRTAPEYHKRYAPALLAGNRRMLADDGLSVRPIDSATN